MDNITQYINDTKSINKTFTDFINNYSIDTDGIIYIGDNEENELIKTFRNINYNNKPNNVSIKIMYLTPIELGISKDLINTREICEYIMDVKYNEYTYRNNMNATDFNVSPLNKKLYEETCNMINDDLLLTRSYYNLMINSYEALHNTDEKVLYNFIKMYLELKADNNKINNNIVLTTHAKTVGVYGA